MKQTSFLLLLITILVACTQSKKNEEPTGKLVEKVFVVNIIAGEKPLEEYLQYHRNIWPEVEAGFKKAGYKTITLYRYDHLLVMTLTVPANADLNAMGKLAESYDPRCAEWNKLMAHYQTGVPGTKPGQTWAEAEPFYIFNNQ